MEDTNSVLSKDIKKYHKSFHHTIYVIIIFTIIFAILIMYQIFNIQILHQQYYENILNNARQTINTLPPRGRIFDRNGELLVSNEQDIIAQYYPTKDLSDKEEWELAHKFSKQFNVDSTLTLREEKDLYVYLNQKTIVASKLTDEEKKDKNLDDRDIDKLVLERITDEELKTLTLEDKSAFRVKIGMNYATKSRFGVIKRNLTKEEVAYLIEHKEEYPGFSVEFDWKRTYLKNDLFKSVLGNVSNEIQGVPKEESEYLSAKGYNLNDRIGISGLEKQYESLLRGSENVYELSVDQNGVLHKDTVREGQNGSDLYLTIDYRLQEKLNTILAEELQSQKVKSDKLQHAMVSIMEVDSGEVLGLASQSFDYNDSSRTSSFDSASLTYLNGFSPGSTVKGATIYMGLDTGVVYPGEVILDAPIYIAGTPMKKSFNNFGPINEVDALRVSSNVYMFHIVMRLGGGVYIPNQPLTLNKDIIEKMRYYYTSFGLGAYTNLDVPNEVLGYTGTAKNIGNSLDYAIGQYDQITLIQLAQYANTIATKGIKYQPFIVKKALSQNRISYEKQPTVLGIVPGNLDYLDNVKRGFIATGNKFDGNPIALKTGTADVDSHYTSNAIVSFAPTDKPKISIACAVPHAVNLNTTNDIKNPCHSIVQKTYAAYNELYPIK